jgi:ATP dependent DNA ligase domain
MLPYPPMQPMLVREPFHRPGWVYEEKVEGWRVLAYKDRERVWLISRNGVDHTRRYGDIAAAIAKLSARTLVLDGEVAVYDQQFWTEFKWLTDSDPEAVGTPPSPWCSTCSTATAGTSARGRDRRARRRRQQRPGLPGAAARA